MKKTINFLALAVGAAIALASVSCAKLDPTEIPAEGYAMKAYLTVKLENGSGASTVLSGRTVEISFTTSKGITKTVQKTTDATGQVKDVVIGIPGGDPLKKVWAYTGWTGGEGKFYSGTGALSNSLYNNSRGVITITVQEKAALK